MTGTQGGMRHVLQPTGDMMRRRLEHVSGIAPYVGCVFGVFDYVCLLECACVYNCVRAGVLGREGGCDWRHTYTHGWWVTLPPCPPHLGPSSPTGPALPSTPTHPPTPPHPTPHDPARLFPYGIGSTLTHLPHTIPSAS